MSGAASRVGRGPQLVVGQDAEARDGSRASTGVRGGWGADALRIQDTDRPQGQTCGCSCPNARWTRSGRREKPRGARSSWKEMPAEEFSYDPSPDPTGPHAPTIPSLRGQVLCQTDMSPGTPFCLG